jgi:hypothetical protein
MEDDYEYESFGHDEIKVPNKVLLKSHFENYYNLNSRFLFNGRKPSLVEHKKYFQELDGFMPKYKNERKKVKEGKLDWESYYRQTGDYSIGPIKRKEHLTKNEKKQLDYENVAQFIEKNKHISKPIHITIVVDGQKLDSKYVSADDAERFKNMVEIQKLGDYDSSTTNDTIEFIILINGKEYLKEEIYKTSAVEIAQVYNKMDVYLYEIEKFESYIEEVMKKKFDDSGKYVNLKIETDIADLFKDTKKYITIIEVAEIDPFNRAIIEKIINSSKNIRQIEEKIISASKNASKNIYIVEINGKFTYSRLAKYVKKTKGVSMSKLDGSEEDYIKIKEPKKTEETNLMEFFVSNTSKQEAIIPDLNRIKIGAHVPMPADDDDDDVGETVDDDDDDGVGVGETVDDDDDVGETVDDDDGVFTALDVDQNTKLYKPENEQGGGKKLDEINKRIKEISDKYRRLMKQ